MHRKDVIWIVALVAALIGSVGLQYAMKAASAVDTVSASPPPVVPDEGDIVIGRSEAPVTVLVLASLTCPHCAQWEATQLPAVERDLVATGKARLVIRDFPLNVPALDAASLVRCLPPERRKAAHSALLVSMNEWAGNGLHAISAGAGLEGAAAEEAMACAGGEDVRDAVIAGADAAMRAYGVKGTPTFVVGRRVLSGAVSADRLSALVDEAAHGP